MLCLWNVSQKFLSIRWKGNMVIVLSGRLHIGY